jgi:ABC-type transporter Mla subunit MlaD
MKLRDKIFLIIALFFLLVGIFLIIFGYYMIGADVLGRFTSRYAIRVYTCAGIYFLVWSCLGIYDKIKKM